MSIKIHRTQVDKIIAEYISMRKQFHDEVYAGNKEAYNELYYVIGGYEKLLSRINLYETCIDAYENYCQEDEE